MANSSNNPEYHGNEEIIERNIERAREVIEKRSQEVIEKHANDKNSGQAQAPGLGDVQRKDNMVAPNQWNQPIGGYQGPNANGGSSRRNKPN